MADRLEDLLHHSDRRLGRKDELVLGVLDVQACLVQPSREVGVSPRVCTGEKGELD